jgi:tetrahydromethanopterin S-methyltransferase subunit A
VTGALGFVDWSPLLSLFGASPEFSSKQVMALGAIAFVKGLVQEVIRRANDPFLKISEVVDAAPEVEKAKKKVKKMVEQTPDVK